MYIERIEQYHRQLAGRIHFVDTPGRPPADVNFRADGIAVCKRLPALCERGDCIWHLGEEI